MAKKKELKTDHIGDLTIYLTQAADGYVTAANYSAVILGADGKPRQTINGGFLDTLKPNEEAGIEQAMSQIRHKVALILPPF